MNIHHITNNGSDLGIVMPVDRMDSLFTKSCIAHIEQSKGVSYDLVVVESCGEEFYYGKSVNAGIKEFNGCEYIVLIDNDATIDENALRTITHYMDTHSDVGLSSGWEYKEGRLNTVGYVHMGGSLDYFSMALRERAPFFAVRRFNMRNNYSYGVKGVKKYKPRKMCAIGGAFCCFGRECLEDIGLIDEDYRSTFVDIDFSFEVMLSPKWYVSTCPAKFQHIGGSTKPRYREFHGALDAAKTYLDKWPKERIAQVLKAAKRNKFLIPEGV